ncbi:hypothetical protein [Arundinibacter roseus]|uniref:Uncharacterized protein n=1 Tax=Arundinibacter roseus TaxID=2070510 RepID=A0A4R4KLC8_9BACT|nr:hypothetical protein [Arundinibacter roseus]TDB69167.1 hypothetical protein EZE20_02185 [Arundinibacter roseus]
MKSLKLFLFIILGITIISCSKLNDITPKNFIKIDKDTYRVKTGLFEDFGYDSKYKEYNMEFALSSLNLSEINSCNGDCDAAVISLDVYGDSKILSNAIYEIDGLNQKYATVIVESVKRGRGSHDFRVTSGTVEIIGNSIPDLTIKINGLGMKGEMISAVYKGNFIKAEL